MKSKLGTCMQMPESKQADNVIVKTDKLPFVDSAVVVRQQKSYFIPAIIYWQKVNMLRCDVNSRYFVNMFSEAFKDAESEFQLKKYLGSRRLEINIESVPMNFIYSDKFYGIFLMICFSVYNESINPIESQFKVTYKIFDGDTPVKVGQYSAVVAKPLKNKFNPHSEFVGAYINDLKSNFEYHTEKVILRILDDLY
ncbi:MAG: hypothetical protein QM800_08950 [Paludibacter sp.]